jgi:hypothetical protein
LLDFLFYQKNSKHEKIIQDQMLLLVFGKLDLEICIDQFTSGQSFLLSLERLGS